MNSRVGRMHNFPAYFIISLGTVYRVSVSSWITLFFQAAAWFLGAIAKCYIKSCLFSSALTFYNFRACFFSQLVAVAHDIRQHPPSDVFQRTSRGTRNVTSPVCAVSGSPRLHFCFCSKLGIALVMSVALWTLYTTYNFLSCETSFGSTNISQRTSHTVKERRMSFSLLTLMYLMYKGLFVGIKVILNGSAIRFSVIKNVSKNRGSFSSRNVTKLNLLSYSLPSYRSCSRLLRNGVFFSVFSRINVYL